MNRRSFLVSLPAVMAGSRMAAHPWENLFPDDDELMCKKKFDLAVSLLLEKKPIGDAVVEIGKTFLGTEYLANGLEMPGDEHLVVNLRGLDCVSFYENALVLARCVKKHATSFEGYKKELQFVRYRGGVIDKYPSRLHYTSDYIYDNMKKGVWDIVTKDLGGVRYSKRIDFMSTHPGSYRQLKENPDFVKVIEEQEREISAREMYYIPKEDGEKFKGLKNGDILGITTSIEGLDVSHTGVAIWKDGFVHLMHAPDVGTKVTISEKPLHDYLGAHKKQTGIMVARPLEP